jgi:hypothetical protein
MLRRENPSSACGRRRRREEVINYSAENFRSTSPSSKGAFVSLSTFDKTV